MNANKYVLFMTGTINTNRDVPFLSVNNNEIRRKQYIDALKYYMTKCNVSKIVFCENSGEECPDELRDVAKCKGVDLEWLTFNGDVEGTIKIGKSYGESELMDYAFSNSRLLRENDYFVKTTGRLMITNFNMMIKLLSEKKNYFVTYGKTQVELVDTRIFAMKCSDYIKYFFDVYGKKIEAKSQSIEHLYPILINNSGISIVSLPCKVCFEGVSGGYGLPYITTNKERIVDTLRKYLFSLGGRRIYLEETSGWQDDMCIPESVWYKYFDELTNKKIILCGAGMMGTRMYKIASRNCKIIAWTDANYRTIKRVYGRRIVPLDDIYRKKVDYYLICVKSKNSYKTIKEDLASHICDEGKIKWVMDLVYNEEDWKIFV